MKWAYGITTVPDRIDSYFPETVNSLAAAGFDKPWLFVDRAETQASFPADYRAWGDRVSFRTSMGTPANWTISLAELYFREPKANMYALFQDDFITCRTLKDYLSSCSYPDKGYFNLYTFPSNQEICPPGQKGWYKSNQLGRGAVALVFTPEGVLTLLTQRHLWERAQGARRFRAIDGGISEAFKKIGWTEYVHNPSLVQHIGDISSMRNRPHLKAESFPGVDFDLLSLC